MMQVECQNHFPHIEHKLYLLLDAAKDKSLPALLPAFKNRGEIYPIYHKTDLDYIKDISPLLVEAEPSGDLMLWYLQSGAPALLGLSLDTPAGLVDLAGHFKTMVEAMMPNNNLAIFRFYNPSSTLALARSFTAAEAAAFLGPVQTLWCPSLDPDGVLSWHGLKNPGGAPGNQDAFWRLSAGQYAALTEQVRLSFLGRISAWLREELGVETYHPEEGYSNIGNFVEDAKTLGLQWEVSFCYYSALRIVAEKNAEGKVFDENFAKQLSSLEFSEEEKLDLLKQRLETAAYRSGQ